MILSHAKIFHRNGERLVTQHLRTTASFSTTRYVLLILVSYLAFVTSKILTLIASESCGTTFFFMSEIDDWNKADVVGAHPIQPEIFEVRIL
ncbi:hypothetical protein CLOP_g13982 [Closterium sp. NIES-67]|nr:hypothetical protein CLOP_g11360 [Closterium sp. NIES-67]GJP83881.1 hypothetical protein CLOP_g13982 [Closterium sp. NIES-67]